ncbi:MAG TPA: TIGR02391 family protein [Nitrospirales bacterium]|nr:TIGR02391 family protein [Nitrospirales bacterium]
MPKRKQPEPPPIEPKEFRSVAEIDAGIKKLERRIEELKRLDIPAAVHQDTGADDVVRSNIRETIREVFGPNSPEFHEHEHIRLWAGPLYLNMSPEGIIDATERGRNQVTGILNGLIERLREKREELGSGDQPAPRTYFQQLNLHPRIAEVANDLFLDGYHWEAVFAAAKALVNYVKERSGLHDLDGAALMRTAFSRANPWLSFNDLSDQTDLDEQEGMMHLFEGAVLGIRNPGGHTFPEGSEQRAMEYISLMSLLAYRVQESKRRKPGA